MPSDDHTPEPLRPAVFHILLALARRDLHGLGIADEVEELTGGQLRLGPGTLYRSLHEMHEGGLIEETAAPRDDADPRRKYYTLTPAGREALAAEAARYQRVVRAAQERDVLSGKAP